MVLIIVRFAEWLANSCLRRDDLFCAIYLDSDLDFDAASLVLVLEIPEKIS